MKRKLFALILIAAIAAAGLMSGCSKGNDGPSGGSGKDISIIYWMSENGYKAQVAANDTVYDPILDAIPVYEEKYNVDVNLIAVPWGDMLSQMTQLQNSGQAPDLVEVYDRTMHNVILNNYVMALDEYVTDEDYSHFKVSRDLFSWNGKTYAIPLKPYLYYIMFNKDMFDMEGLPYPDELFRNGEWTFDKFEEVGKALTKYVDGERVQYAFTSWTEHLAATIVSNGSAIVKIDNQNGTAESGLSDPKTIRALEYLSRWVNPVNGIIEISDNMWGDFDNNRCAMNRGKEYPDGWDLPFATGMVPLPAGPDAPPKSVYVYPQAMAVPTGSKNPEAAVEFMRIVHQRQKEVGDAKEAARIGQENYDMIYSDDTNFIYAYDKGIEGYDEIEAMIYEMLVEGIPPATIAETIAPDINAAIEMMFK
ncbi:MAG TPA: extracellular solute-binding protein [Candidatus Atribacteria bacterium]|nr:extracellular solute-binding protein [Candidatus Atribacteria bacterium]HPT77562.1 extracellular solute-binding protein [Candidatus Atribacteria bacterium]